MSEPPSLPTMGGSDVRQAMRVRSPLGAFAVLAIVVTALYVARDVIIPIVLAILLSFVLGPLVRFLQRAGLGRVMPVVLAVMVALGVFLALFAVVAVQLSELLASLPTYQSIMLDKARSLRDMTSVGVFDRINEVVARLAAEFQIGPRLPAQQPVPVTIDNGETGPFATIGRVIGPLLHPLGVLGLVILFAVFFLLQRDDLRDRFIRLAGSQDLQRTTSAIDDAAKRLSRLFLTQFALNAAYGTVIAIGLLLIGVPSAILFGILACVLRFVPYIGAIIGAVLPVALAVAVEPGWGMALMTAALFILIEPLVGHVIEPLIYGRSTGLSPVAVVLAATFWTWLWGPIGLLLATPLTVCLVVIGRHVEDFEFMDVALGDRTPLTPAQTLYQRLLAGNPDEASAQAETLLQESDLVAYLDTVALPALFLAQHDASRGVLDDARLARIKATIQAFVGDLVSDDMVASQPTPADGPRRPLILVGGRNAVDEAAMALFAEILRRHGALVLEAGASSLSAQSVGLPELRRAGFAVIGFVHEGPIPPALRYRVRRLARAAPDVKLLVCVLGGQPGQGEDAIRGIVGVDAVCTSMGAALSTSLDWMTELAPAATPEEKPGSTRVAPPVTAAPAPLGVLIDARTSP